MDEMTPIDNKPVPAVPRRGGSSASTQRFLMLIVGAAFGAGAVVVGMKLAEQPKTRPAFVAQNQVPQTALGGSPGVGTQPNAALGTDLPKVDPAKPGEAKATDPSPTAPPTAPGGTTPAGAMPYNPFDGSVNPLPNKQISGHIDPTGPGITPPANPTQGGAKPTPAAVDLTTDQEVPKGLLVTVRLDVGDPNSAVGALSGMAQKFGGSAVQFDDSATHPDAEGALVFVPASKAADLEKALASVGSVAASDRWNGSNSSRIDRIESSVADRLTDLKMKRQELLVKYFEDAPQVKHIDEDMNRIERSLKALRGHRAGSTVAIFKIKFLG